MERGISYHQDPRARCRYQGVARRKFNWLRDTFLYAPRLIWGGRRAGSPAEFAGLFNQLREAQRRLEEASGGLETQFLATSSELEGLAKAGGEFVKHVEKLVGLATGKGCDTSVFSSAIQLVKESTQFLVDCQEQTARLLESLRNHNEQIEKLLKIEGELQRTMLPLKFVQVLFKAEAAPLGAGVQQMFSALTEEIGGLHNQVREIFGTKFKQLEQTHQTIARVVAQLEEQSRVLQNVTTTYKAGLDSSLETLRKEMVSNQERDVKLHRLSKDLAREIGQIVVGLQIQDIVNQKLQHVMAALPKVEAAFNEFEQSNSVDFAQPLQFLQQSCRLEAGQLESAQSELAGAEASIQTGVQKVIAHLGEIDSDSLSLKEFKLLTTSFDGIVQVLVEIISEVRELVDAAVSSAADAYELLRPLGSLASDLTTIVRGMSAQIHLIGLNAQVQAALASKDRRGAGLEVLSARTNDISDETNRISERAAEALDTLVAGLADSVKRFEELRASGLQHQTRLREQGGTEELRLHAFRDEALNELRSIGESLDSIGAHAQQTSAAAQFTNFHGVELPAFRQSLMAIADGAEKAMRARGHDSSGVNLVEGFRRDYTMASEHKVFADTVSSGGRLEPPPTGEKAMPEIELFTESSEGENIQRESEAGGKESPSEVTAAEPASSGSDLGGNVELF